MTARQRFTAAAVAVLLIPILVAVAAVLAAGNTGPITCPATQPPAAAVPYRHPDPCPPIESPVTP